MEISGVSVVSVGRVMTNSQSVFCHAGGETEEGSTNGC